VLQDKTIPDYVTIYRIHGPFLFGATDKLTNLTSHVHEMTPIVVLRLRNMTAIDATGLRVIRDFADALHSSGRTLLLCGALSQPATLMAQSEFHRHVGAENILPNVDAALRRPWNCGARSSDSASVVPPATRNAPPHRIPTATHGRGTEN
jgi:sulfate permease, SulP family